MTIPTLLAILVLVVGVPLNAYVTLTLWRLSRQSGSSLLRERTVAGLFILIVITVYAVSFLNNDLKPPPLDFETTKYLSRTAMLAIAVVPALYLLRLIRR